MQVKDLAPRLQKPYSSSRGYGIEKGQGSQFSHLWFVVPPPPSQDPPVGIKPQLLKKAHEVLAQLPRLETLSESERLILGLLVKREALQSSRMEGTFSTIEQVLTPGEFFDKQEKSARASVVGYAHALESAFEQAHQLGVKIFKMDLIRKMHKEMMARDPQYRGKSGSFRDEIGSGLYVHIGGLNRPEDSIYNPSPPGHVIEGIRQNLAWLSDEDRVERSRAGMGPGLVVNLARAHSHFEAVHPFSDGNGRVGRMLMTLQMVCEGYSPLYLSGYIEAKKEEYSKCLNIAQMKLDEGPLVHFLSEAIVSSWEESVKTKAVLNALPEQWRERGKFRDRSAAQRALRELLATPILTAKHLEKKLEVSNPAAFRAIDQLCRAGILRERTGFARNRIFAAEEVIEVLARPFGEAPEIALQKAASPLA